MNDKSLTTYSCVRLIVPLVLSTLLYPAGISGSEPIIDVIPEDTGLAMEEIEAWEEEIFSLMAEEDLPRFWAIRRTPESIKRVLEFDTPPASALIEIAEICTHQEWQPQWCRESELVTRIRDTAPDNVLSYFIDGPIFNPISLYNLQRFGSLVTEVNLERIRLASQATYADGYYSDEIPQWRDSIKKHVKNNPQPSKPTSVLLEHYREGIPLYSIRSYAYPEQRLAWKLFQKNGENSWSSGENALDELPELCVAMLAGERTEAVSQCRIISEILLDHSVDNRMKGIGYQTKYYLDALEGVDDLQTAWREINRDMQASEYVPPPCSEPHWFSGERVPIQGWSELDFFYNDLRTMSVTEAKARAAEREMEFLGLSIDEEVNDDPCGYEFASKEYENFHEEILKSGGLNQ